MQPKAASGRTMDQELLMSLNEDFLLNDSCLFLKVTFRSSDFGTSACAFDF